ncbi:MAG: cation diffusion facilitator family transporter [Gemmataceae bacterium]|nr:cation diffusion facilitator family transporter [Gemmataceae bacterium]MDW8266004.1 cation diffusion facilitator family transporter [Gemmataceae bacterium]
MVPRQLRVPIILSILAALVTIGLKYTAYLLTNSVGLLADAVESVVNLLAAVTAFLSLVYSAMPADRTHTYGHEKIEFFSSGLEGILILVAGGGIAWLAVKRLIVPEPLQPLDVGLLVATVASGINLVVARFLLRVGRKYRSIVLEADGQHLMTDVWTSVGVLVGVGLVRLTGWQFLDPLVALAVAANIGWTAWDLLTRSFHGLMDHALPPEDQAKVRAAIASCLEPGMDFHAVRTRLAGARRFVDFHLLVPGHYTVRRAHALASRIEAAVEKALPDIEVTIHMEPIEEAASWDDSALLALEREDRRLEQEEQRRQRAQQPSDGSG